MLYAFVLSIVMLSAIILNVTMLSVLMPTAIMLSAVVQECSLDGNTHFVKKLVFLEFCQKRER
jgi:hypothetical protein